MTGRREQNLPGKNTASVPDLSGTSLLAPQLLRRLYRYMLKCRMTGERARSLSSKCRSGMDFHVGWEATGVGAAIDLLPEDTLGLSPRNRIIQLVKGAPLRALFTQLMARNSNTGHRSAPPSLVYAPLNVVLPASTAGAQLALCTGIALGYKLQKRLNIVVAVADAESATLKNWQEALHCASREKLPIVYVIKNQFEPHPSPACPESHELRLKAEAYGIPGITVDASDVVAVYRVCHESRERARQGYGPTLVECASYDYCKGRSNGKVDHQILQPGSSTSDPIAAMEHYLHRRQLWDEPWKQQVIAEIVREIDQAVKLAGQR